MFFYHFGQIFLPIKGLDSGEKKAPLLLPSPTFLIFLIEMRAFARHVAPACGRSPHERAVRADARGLGAPVKFSRLRPPRPPWPSSAACRGYASQRTPTQKAACTHVGIRARNF